MDGWLRWTPGLRSLRGYRRGYLGPDVLAGIALATVVIPLGMAYASLAGLEPITGLYASLASLLVYGVFGPSRLLVLGPDSSTAPLVAAVVIPLTGSDLGARAALAAALGLLVGAIALTVAITKLGFITDLLSKPVRIGYMNGLAVFIVVSQLAPLFGFARSGDGFVSRVAGFAVQLDQTDALALTFGIAALIAVLLIRKTAPRVPGLLIVVALAIAVSRAIGAAALGVPVLGVLPQGLPDISLPTIGLRELQELMAGAIGIAAITLADSSVLSQSLAARHSYRVNANEEIAALGVSNLAAGLFGGFPVSGSLTRSAVNVSSGARTQLAGVFAAVAVGGLIVFAPALLAAMPMPVLAAIVIAAGVGLADVQGVLRLWQVRRTEFTVSIATTFAVLVLGVLSGVFVAIALSLLNFMRRQWHPHDAVLGRVPGFKGYHDISEFPDARQVPGLLLYRFDAPLFFANANVFRERLLTRIAEQQPIRRVVLASAPLIDVDSSAADTLAEVIATLAADGIEFGFAELKHPVRERMERYGTLELVDAERLYPTIGLAVRGYVRDTSIDWVDWEDEV